MCEQCGAANPLAASFCRQCGRPWTGLPIRSATRVTPEMRQWRALHHRMTRKEVRRLLGEPLRIELVDAAVDAPGTGTAGPLEQWAYEYEVAGRADPRIRGSLLFSVGEGTLTHWSEPAWPTGRTG
jgi:hypothetical protein